MESLILVLTSLLFVPTLTDENLGNSNDNFKLDNLPYNVLPENYEIYLDLCDITYGNISFNGTSTITVWVTRPTRYISFHADRSQIQKLHFYVITYIWKPDIHYFPEDFVYNNTTAIYTYYFKEKITPAYYVIHLEYSVLIEDSSKRNIFKTSFINDEGKRTRLVATDLWPIGARRLFPCWDELSFPARFKITIKPPKNYKILSNMPSREEKITEENDIIQTYLYFEETPLIPTYQVSAILLSHFLDFIVDDVHIIYRSQLNFSSMEFAKIAINKMSRYLQQSICSQDLKQISHVTIPGFLYDAVSNVGIISYRETAIIYDDGQDQFIREIDIARLLGRAMAHQCLNNRLPSWSQMWLNQGISTLLAMDAIDQAFPNYGIKDLFVVQILQESLRLDVDSIMKPLIHKINTLSDIESMSFSFGCYIKGPAILRMLQQTLGNDVFQEGIKKYFSTTSYNIENIRPFVFAMQTVHEDHKHDTDQLLNVTQITEAWIMEEHYPELKVVENDNVITVTTKIIKTNVKEWWIPYTLTIQPYPYFSLSKPRVLNLNLTYEDLIPDTYINLKNKWVIINLQQIGYYRVNYDATNLRKIINYLNSDERTKIHVLNRAQIIDDAFYFLIKGELDLSMFMSLATYLSFERNYIAWYPMIKAFEYMSSFLPYTESWYIRTKMINILNTLHQEMGYERKSDPKHINSSLKQEVARWACAFGSLECKKQAYFILKSHLMQEKYLLPWWKEWTYCNGLAIENVTIWNKVFDIYIKKPDYTLSKFLACSQSFSIISYYLEFASKGYIKSISDNDRIYIFHSIVAKHAKNDPILDYILANFDKVKPRHISVTAALIDIINHVYTKDSLNKINKFVESHSAMWSTNVFEPLIEDKFCIKNEECTEGMSNERVHYLLNLINYGKNSFLRRKIELRSSEITRHLHQFKKFVFNYY